MRMATDRWRDPNEMRFATCAEGMKSGGAKNMTWAIALCIAPVSDNQVRMIRGVLQYISEYPDLRVYKEGALPYLPWDRLSKWKGDGVIATTESEDRRTLLIKRRTPCVSVTGHVTPVPELPAVLSDNDAIGRAAAEHLLDQGLQQFTYVGNFDWYTDRMRLKGFAKAVASVGPCTEIDIKFKRRKSDREISVLDIDTSHLAKRLSDLPTPNGIGVAHDEFAHDVVTVSKLVGKQIPYDCCVVGVNDHRLICETTDPSISSVQQQAERIGYEAASMLHSLLKGEPHSGQVKLLPPGEVVIRRSSDYLAVDDPIVREAIHEIRRFCGQPITAEDIADKLPVTRRTLDKRFTAAVGHPPAEEIRLSRIRLAKELLRNTDLQIVAVGMRCGFESTSGFIRAFRQSTGTTPRRYRVER